MNLVDFPEAHVVIAENQTEYLPMPAYIYDDQVLVCCWKLSLRERLSLLFHGEIWHSVWTFGKHLQPQRLDVHKPLMHMDTARTQQRADRQMLVLKNENKS
jgi:hypothetical protein